MLRSFHYASRLKNLHYMIIAMGRHRSGWAKALQALHLHSEFIST
jgi:hypothetical protein